MGPGSWNPEFFAYGGLPIYAIYFVGVGINFFSRLFTQMPQNIYTVSFEQAIIISRLFSAFFSVGLLVVLLRIRNFFTPYAFWITFLVSVFSVGFIQYAHFGTFEMWLTFFTLLFFVSIVLLFQARDTRYLILTFVVYGALLGIKVSSLFLFPLIPIFLFIYYSQLPFAQMAARVCLLSLLALIVSCVLFLITNPFFIFDNSSYVNSILYEGKVAGGTLPVFYTERFYGTVPILFHLTSVFPFLLNPLNTLLLLVAVPIGVYSYFRTRDLFLLLTIVFFLVLFLSQTFLFTKWNRYVIPALPYAYFLIGFVCWFFVTKIKWFSSRVAKGALMFIVVGVAVVFSVSFFITTYRTDSRVEAFLWASVNVPHGARIGTEIYDLGLMPFEGTFSDVHIFDQYGFENSTEEVDASEYEYVLFPSQRVMRSRIELPHKFPKGHAFYSGFWEESNGFKLVYTTPCDIFCKIAYLGDPIFRLEETSNVFDRPVVSIYKRWEDM